MGYIVLDTDVFSYLFKKDSRGERYRPHLEGQTLCISFQTVAELYQWAEMNDWSDKRRKQLQEGLRNFVVLPYDNETAWVWARIRAARQKQGHQIAPQDAWIAASALRHSCPLITHNAQDYSGIPGLEVVSEPG